MKIFEFSKKRGTGVGFKAGSEWEHFFKDLKAAISEEVKFSEDTGVLTFSILKSKFKVSFKFDGLENVEDADAIPNFLNDLCSLVAGLVFENVENYSIFNTISMIRIATKNNSARRDAFKENCTTLFFCLLF